MTQPTLATARLRLRPFAAADAPALHACLGDPRVMRYWGDLHLDLSETEAFVAATIAAPHDQTCDFVIERDGQVIGKAGMWKAPEIGFFLHPDHQRQGIMREALTAVIAHLLATYQMPALIADVDPRNQASLRLLEGLGFVETHRAEGTDVIDGELVDSVYLALRRAL